MSEIKKDERLVELMSEFLETTDEESHVASSSSSSDRGADNTRLLSAIEGQQYEINELKHQIQELKTFIESKSEDATRHAEIPISAEIIVLQTTVSDQKEQIEKLTAGFEEFKQLLDRTKVDPNEGLAELKNKIDHLEHDVLLKQQEVKGRITASLVPQPDISSLEKTVSDQIGQIDVLVKGYEKLKNDLEHKKSTHLEQYEKLQAQVLALNEEIVQSQQKAEKQAAASLDFPDAITSIQTNMVDQNSRVEQVLQKQEQFKKDLETKRALQEAELKKLKDQLESLREEVWAKEEKSEALVSAVTQKEVSNLENKIANYGTKIGDLEYKHKMLKTDIARKKEPRRGGFGALGWGLLISNILLWSVLAFFFWSQGKREKAELFGKNSTKKDIPARFNKEGHAVISKEAYVENEMEQTATTQNGVDQNKAEQQGLEDADQAIVQDASKAEAVSTKNVTSPVKPKAPATKKKISSAKKRTVRKTVSPSKKTTSKKRLVKKKRVPLKQAVETVQKSSNEPDVSFED